MARVDRVLAECRRFQTPMAVLSVAIDDVLADDGRHAPELASAVALEFGHRLRGRVRGTDHMLWIGGRDYGVVLLSTGREGARAVRSRLELALGGVYRLEPELATVTMSIGHAIYPIDGANGLQLVTAACAARSAG